MVKHDINNLKHNTANQRKIVNQMKSLSKAHTNSVDPNEKEMIQNEVGVLQNSMQNINKKSFETAKKASMYKPLNPEKAEEEGKSQKNKIKRKPFELTDLERKTMKKIKKGDKDKKDKGKKQKKPNIYLKLSSKFFYNTANSLLKKDRFRIMKRQLVKSNLEFVPANYISFMFFTTLISLGVSVFIWLFFMFFNIIALPPFIVGTEDMFFSRFLKTSWIMILIPVVTYMFIYFYPSMERKSLENKINHELPFATIHMSAISGSLIEPSKIFEIIVKTKEYPYISKELTKLINEINIYGYDLVTALRNRAFNSPSKKLAELFNGLATTITSGGSLPDFFEKRSQTLLFEYRIEKEKESKSAETFMDIYISVVIAAPMILMLLLVMMRMSGLGFSLSTTMITIIMVSGVSLLNILFLAFLHIKQPNK